MKNLLFFTAVILLASCSTDNFDETTTEELPFEAVEVELDDLISFRVSSASAGILSTGDAYRSTFSDVQYIVASEGVEVECPGSSTSYMGDGDYFNIAWIEMDDGVLVYNAGFTATIDGQRRVLTHIVPQECGERDLSVDYEEQDGRLVGTCTGRFYYIDYQGEPFEDCMNFVDAGILEARFDVPLTICN